MTAVWRRKRSGTGETDIQILATRITALEQKLAEHTHAYRSPLAGAQWEESLPPVPEGQQP